MAFANAILNAIASSNTLTVWVDRHFGNTKLAIVLAPILLALGMVAGMRTANKRSEIPLGMLAFLLVALGLIHRAPHPAFPELWAGFGLGPALTSICAATIYLALKRLHGDAKLENRILRTFATVVIPLIFLIPYITVYIQPPNGLINLGDTTYHVLDELLAPSQGAFPYADYSPQYTGALGWMITPLLELPVSSRSAMTLVILASNIFNFLVPLLVMLTIRALLPTAPRILTFAATVFIWTVSGSQRGGSVNLREFSHFARFIPVLLALWILAHLLVARSQKQAHYAILSGICSFIAVFNSADYGLTFEIVLLFSLTLATIRNRLPTRILFLHLTSITCSALCVLLAYRLAGRSFSFDSYIGLRSGIRTLYGTGDLELLGPHLMAMSIAVCSIGVGIAALFRANHAGVQIAIPIICLTLGLWLTVLIGRFLLSPQVVNAPPLFIPSSIAFALIVQQLSISSATTSQLVNPLRLMPLLIVACLPIGALWQMPDPRDEILRISGRYVGTTNWSSSPGRVSDGWSPEALAPYANLLREAQLELSMIDGEVASIGYFGPFGHSLEVLTGVDNVIGIPAPESLRFGTKQEVLACTPVDRQAPVYVLVSEATFPCLNYEIDSRLSNSELAVWRRLEVKSGN